MIILNLYYVRCPESMELVIGYVLVRFADKTLRENHPRAVSEKDGRKRSVSEYFWRLNGQECKVGAD